MLLIGVQSWSLRVFVPAEAAGRGGGVRDGEARLRSETGWALPDCNFVGNQSQVQIAGHH